jgi:hypothetical protein
MDAFYTSYHCSAKIRPFSATSFKKKKHIAVYSYGAAKKTSFVIFCKHCATGDYCFNINTFEKVKEERWRIQNPKKRTRMDQKA